MSNTSQIVRISRGTADAMPSPVGSAMWRLLPVLAVLGCLEIFVPWPDIAALVLTDTSRADAHAISPHQAWPVIFTETANAASSDRRAVDARRDPSPLLVQARVISP